MNWSSFTKKPAPKTIMIGFVLVILCACNGAIPIMTYITYIFKDVESNLSPNETAIIAGLIQVIGVGIAIQLVDRLGRKARGNLFCSFILYMIQIKLQMK